jgi:hypothetical protein
MGFAQASHGSVAGSNPTFLDPLRWSVFLANQIEDRRQIYQV